jgi:hypothetical protein
MRCIAKRVSKRYTGFARKHRNRIKNDAQGGVGNSIVLLLFHYKDFFDQRTKKVKPTRDETFKVGTQHHVDSDLR